MIFCFVPGMKSTKIPNRNKLITILMIPVNKPRVTAISEGAIEGLILATELITVPTSNETVAIIKIIRLQLVYIHILLSKP